MSAKIVAIFQVREEAGAHVSSNDESHSKSQGSNACE